MMPAEFRLLAVTVAVALAAAPLSGCAAYQKARQTISDHLSSAEPTSARNDQQRIELIDRLRPRGSFEAARDHLTTVAGSVAAKISDAAGGALWKFDSASDLATDYRHGLPCDNGLFAGTARRPFAEPVLFDPPLTSEGFRAAVGVIRREAAALGATQESSLFDDAAKREYFVSGNGYTFRILQMDAALLTVEGDCHLLQKVVDSPPGTLPG